MKITTVIIQSSIQIRKAEKEIPWAWNNLSHFGLNAVLSL